ncbi:MAG TPA: PH domain-containing protein [Saprospiraceae bacterium]|nr:PH domain-containing protein [Saprospiraceae bacterium]
MKKNEFDFSVPNRQSYVAILMILFKTVNVLFRQLLPFVVVVLLGGSKSKTSYLLYTIVAVAVISMVYSVINFFKTYFIIQDGELVLFTGIFNKKKMSIPFAKIQTINFEQNIIHQFFSVLRLKVDTAGSEKNEFEFHAIQTDKAHALRDLVMSEKKAFVSKNDQSDVIDQEETRVIYKPIMSLTTTELFKVGITENHLKSGGLIFLFFFWIYQNLQEVGVDVDEYSEEIPDVELGFAFIAFVVAVFLIVSIMISMVRIVVQHYDLQFLRSRSGFKIISGLFTKKEISALDHKIQHISWSDNLLKRLAGFKNLYLNQASSAELTSKQNINIPGCNISHITEVVRTLFGTVDFESFEMHKIDKRYFYRFTVIIGIVFALLSGLAYFLDQTDKIVYGLLVVLYLIGFRYVGYRKKTFGHDGELLYIKGGVFGDKAEVLPIFKIQAIELHQSPYQFKNQLCSISLYTASGRIMIPYISNDFAKNLSDIFLRKVESDRRRWM